jgi:two-component system sensor histidine kinase UhpB
MNYKIFSQQEKIDSIQNLLNQHPQRDTVRVKLLLDLGKILTVTDIEKSKLNSEEVLSISDSLNYKYGMAFGYLRLGTYCSMKNNDADALNYYKKSLEISDQIKNNYIAGVVYTNLGTYYIQKLGNLDSGLVEYNNAIQHLEKTDNKEFLGLTLSNMGGIYIHKGEFKKALEYYLRAQKLLEESDSKLYLSGIYFNLSEIYGEEMKNDIAAKNYAEKALNVSEESGSKHGIAQGYTMLGQLEKNPVKARDYYNKALSILVEIGDKVTTSELLNLIGQTFAYSEPGINYDSAIVYCKKSLEVNSGYQLEFGRSHEFIGYAFYKKGSYENAITHCLLALEVAQKIESRQMIKDVWVDLRDVYAASGNYKKAYEYNQFYSALKDSLLDAEKIKLLDEMSTKYETEKKEKAIALLNSNALVKDIEIKKQTLLKNSFIAGFALLVLLSFFVYNTLRTLQKLKLQTLRNKIASDLHDDVGSTLSSIALFSDVAQQQSKDVIPMLQSINESSRKMLDAMADIVWTINPENDNFEKIILRMRSFAYELLGAKKIDFDFKTDETVSESKLSMQARKNLYLIFKEAINNLVKYSEANRASFSITGTKNNLTMIIRDNGKGFDLEKLTQGNGLKNMKKRAMEIGAKLLIESEPNNGTTIQLILAA